MHENKGEMAMIVDHLGKEKEDDGHRPIENK